MLDIPTYRHFEEIAKAASPSWRLPQRHNVHFVYKLSMLPQLRAYLDAMQDCRYDAFMREMGGLDQHSLQVMVQSCKDIANFQQIYFQGYPIILPFSSMLSALCIYEKIAGLKPNFKNVLEIGAGSGLFSFILKNAHPQLENYSMIEACETFYLLQHYINTFLFDKAFDQRLYPEIEKCIQLYAGEFIGVAAHGEFRFDSAVLEAVAPKKKVVQYPWWNVGQMLRDPVQFDVVLSNANLNEYFRPALDDYLELVKRKLAPNGIFFAQCYGGGRNGEDDLLEHLYDQMYQRGFAPLFMCYAGVAKNDSRFATDDNYFGLDPADQRYFALKNGVWITEKHDLFSQCYDRRNFRNGFFCRESGVKEAMFGRRGGSRTYYKPEELTAKVKSQHQAQ